MASARRHEPTAGNVPDSAAYGDAVVASTGAVSGSSVVSAAATVVSTGAVVAGGEPPQPCMAKSPEKPSMAMTTARKVIVVAECRSELEP